MREVEDSLHATQIPVAISYIYNLSSTMLASRRYSRMHAEQITKQDDKSAFFLLSLLVLRKILYLKIFATLHQVFHIINGWEEKVQNMKEFMFLFWQTRVSK